MRGMTAAEASRPPAGQDRIDSVAYRLFESYRLTTRDTVCILVTVRRRPTQMLSNTHFAMAIHVLSALAYNDGQLMGSDDLAKSVGTNPSFLRGLIGRLREAGLVETQMGKGGGARLARKASKISLRDVYLATEDRPAVKAHGCCDKSMCPVSSNMNTLLSDINSRVENAVESELKRTTVADLLTQYMS